VLDMLQDLTARARDSLVSFGERLSTRLFAALLNSQVCQQNARPAKSSHESSLQAACCDGAALLHSQVLPAVLQGVRAQQHDAWDIGVTTNDAFGNADVNYPLTLPAVRQALTRLPGDAPCVPIVTGFLGRGHGTGGRKAQPSDWTYMLTLWQALGSTPPMASATCCQASSVPSLLLNVHSSYAGAITTLGRGGSDLTATLIGAALGVQEVQVWKDVDGASTCRTCQMCRTCQILLA
jgi:aspartate kinase